jgi:hypothetical protein
MEWPWWREARLSTSSIATGPSSERATSTSSAWPYFLASRAHFGPRLLVTLLAHDCAHDCAHVGGSRDVSWRQPAHSSSAQRTVLSVSDTVEDMSKICRVQNACLVHVHDETACQPILTLKRLSRLGGSSMFVLTGSALEIERNETALCTKVGSGLGLNSTRLLATARPPYHSPAHKPHLSTLLL